MEKRESAQAFAASGDVYKRQVHNHRYIHDSHLHIRKRSCKNLNVLIPKGKLNFIIFAVCFEYHRMMRTGLFFFPRDKKIGLKNIKEMCIRDRTHTPKQQRLVRSLVFPFQQVAVNRSRIVYFLHSNLHFLSKKIRCV